MDLYRRRRIDAHIDMTPMIDTLLQLFMIFLLSASFVASTVRLDLPRAGVERNATTERIVVSLDASQNAYLNDRPVFLSDLPTRLKALIDKSQNHVVLLRADRALAYEKVLEIMVDIQRSGAEHVVLASNLRGKP
jgi:biopolymer transport protein ExbD